MLDNLFDLVKSHATEAVINNPDVPNEHNDAVVAEATHSIASGLQSTIAGGGLQNILSLFGGNQAGGNVASNPVVSSIIGNLTSNLMSKFGLGNAQASGVANSLIPNVINSLISKTNDPNNSSFSLDSLLHSLTGGQSTQIAQQQQANGNSGFSFQNLISEFTGGGVGNGNSGGGLMDIVSKLAGGAQNQQQQGAGNGGGLMDIIKGFMK